MGGEDEQQHLFVPRMGYVSRALWPANIRRSVLTDRAAQRRRSLLINRRGCLLFFDILFAHCPYVLATLLIIGSSLAVAILGLRFWFLLLLPILALIVILIAPAIAAAREQSLAEEATPSMPAQECKRLPGISVPSSFPGVPASKSFPGFSTGRSFPGVPSSQHAPETPMPAELPLIRVLETFDLRQMELPPDDTSPEQHIL